MNLQFSALNESKGEDIMKKTLIALTALTLLTALSGCGSAASTAQDASPAAETTAAVTEETTIPAEETAAETTETEAAADTTAAETSAETDESAADTTTDEGRQVTPITDEAALIDLTYDLLTKYSYIDGVSACCLRTDSNDRYQPADTEIIYERVTEENYSTTDDIKQLISVSLTGEAEEKYLHDIFEDLYPIYIDKDGKLYMLIGGRGSGFDFDKDSIQLSDITDDGYTATVSYPLPGDTVTSAVVTVKRTDGEYRISSFKENA